MSLDTFIPIVSLLNSAKRIEFKHVTNATTKEAAAMLASKDDPDGYYSDDHYKWMLEEILICQIEGCTEWREVEILQQTSGITTCHFNYGSGSAFRQFLQMFCTIHSIPFDEC